jgi:SOS response regulatory protein OraA/RecX
LLLSFKGSEKALFGAIMNANKLGVSLEKSKDISNSLLNFEESISAELEAELLTGKDFNLDLARSLALQGDFVGATEAALSNIHSISEFEQMNVLARKASAKALGMTVDELSDALIQQELIRNGQKEQYDRFLEFGDKRAAQQLLEGKLDKEAIEAANKRLDAEERFGIQLNKAKETFTSFVENGTLQNLADIVE